MICLKRISAVSAVMSLVCLGFNERDAMAADSIFGDSSSKLRPIRPLAIPPALPSTKRLESKRYIFGTPSLVCVEKLSETEGIYLLALPFKLPTAPEYKYVETNALIRKESQQAKLDSILELVKADDKDEDRFYDLLYADYEKVMPPDRVQIVSAFPINEVLTFTYKRTNTLAGSLSPSFAGFGAGSISGSAQSERGHSYLSQYVVGAFDNDTGSASWDYYPNGEQDIQRGFRTSYVVLRMKNEDSVVVTPYINLTEDGFLFFKKARTVMAPNTAPLRATEAVDLLSYAKFHNSEISANAAAFLQGLKASSVEKAVRAELLDVREKKETDE